MPNNYRVGIIGRDGKGGYGHDVDLAFTKLANVEIVAVADEGEAGREAAQQRTKAARTYADYREMLAREQLDLVAVCPRWIDQHHDMLVACAEAHCHVYMEKPFCRTLAECDDVVQQFDMRHLKLAIAHVAQYSAVLDMVVQLIKQGEIGELLEIRARGKEDQRGGGEDLWVLGSHVLAMMRTLAGSDPVACTASVMVQGRAAKVSDVLEGNEGIGPLTGDHIEAKYDFAGGVTGYFASRRGMGANPSRFALQVFGSKGVMEFESGYLRPAYILRDGSWSPGRSNKNWEVVTSAGIGQPEPRTDGNYEGGHVAAIRDLMESIEQQRSTRCDARDGRKIVEMISAVFESHRQQRRVDLPLDTRENPLALWASSASPNDAR